MREKGQTLMIVITILTLLFVVGIAFFTLSQAEKVASLRYLDSLRARYITEAGVAYAFKVLKLDRQANIIDSLEDMTFKHFLGADVDLDQDAKPESRWFNVEDSNGNTLGRFAIKISDEASKVNLHSTSTEALKQLFSQLGADASKADTLLSAQPFNAVEEAGAILGKKDFASLKDFLTIYSRDGELDLQRKRRPYLNSASLQVIFEAFLAAGMGDPFQKAANLKDASDSDLCQTRLDKFSRGNIAPTQLLEAGSWVKISNIYQAQSGEAPGRFVWSNLPVEDGEYYCYFYGPEGVVYYNGVMYQAGLIGEAYLDSEEELGELLYSGEGLTRKVRVSGGALAVNIKPVKDQACHFSHITLVSLESKSGLTSDVVFGSEALAINELMVKPSQDILMPNPAEIPSGQSFRYTFTGIKPASYYVVVLARKTGELVGDVAIYGKNAENLYDADYFSSSIDVTSDGAITLQIKNNSLGVAGFKGIRILQQPDAEFIELLNLSAQEIDLSNFSFEVYSVKDEFVLGWPGRIPEGTKIQPYQHLVFAVDNNDGQPSPNQLSGNKISFQGIWGFNAIGLVFDEHLASIDKSFDLLPDKGAMVILKDNAGRQVDAVEYSLSQVKDFVSLERADPSARTDGDKDGLFDAWQASENEKGATPASTNENSGMYTRSESDPNTLIKHSPGEIVIFNRKLASLAEALKLSDGREWKRFSLSDVSRIADRFAYQAIELDLAAHYKTGEFEEKSGAFESLHKGEAGVWEFTGIPLGKYLLTIFSDNLSAEGEKIQAAYRADSKEEFKDFQSLLFSRGIALYGRVELKQDNRIFQLKIINDSEKKLALKAIRLEPVNSRPGRINVNTAKPEVLRSVLGSDDLIQTVIQNRPIGNKDNRRLGIGELFLLNSGFLFLHDSLTIKSDVFEIKSRGEYSPTGKTIAYQTIRAVLERGD